LRCSKILRVQGALGAEFIGIYWHSRHPGVSETPAHGLSDNIGLMETSVLLKQGCRKDDLVCLKWC